MAEGSGVLKGWRSPVYLGGLHSRKPNVQEMMDNVRSYLRITQAVPKLVKNYIRERHIQSAAR